MCKKKKSRYVKYQWKMYAWNIVVTQEEFTAISSDTEKERQWHTDETWT